MRAAVMDAFGQGVWVREVDAPTIENPGVPALGLGPGSITRFCPPAGGLPVVVDGELVGGIGASGGSLDQDAGTAQAGLTSPG